MTVDVPQFFAMVDEHGSILYTTVKPAGVVYTPKPGEIELASEPDPTTQYIKNGEARNYPEKPGEWAAWDLATESWVDPRTEDDLSAELAAWRAQAKITKTQLLLRASAAPFNILSEEDALAIAEGAMPPGLSAMFSSLPPEALFEATLRWKLAIDIERMHPLILGWTAILGVSDETVDLIFGRET